MTGFTSILVPLDGSPSAEQALPLAEYLASLTRGRLDVVMVHRPAPIWYLPGSGTGSTAVDRAIRRREWVYLERVAGRFRAGTGLPAHAALLDDGIVPGIRDYVQQHSIDVVVLTTHSRAGLSRLWQGTVGESLVRSLNIPVLVIHPTRETQVRAPTIRGILLPHAGAAPPASVLHRAKYLAGLTGATMVLAPILATESHLIMRPNVARRLLALAANQHCDMMVLGSGGTSGWPGAIRESIAHAVIRNATVPVLIVPPSDSSNREPLTAAGVERGIAMSAARR